MDYEARLGTPFKEMFKKNIDYSLLSMEDEAPYEGPTTQMDRQRAAFGDRLVDEYGNDIIPSGGVAQATMGMYDPDINKEGELYIGRENLPSANRGIREMIARTGFARNGRVADQKFLDDYIAAREGDKAQESDEPDDKKEAPAPKKKDTEEEKDDSKEEGESVKKAADEADAMDLQAAAEPEPDTLDTTMKEGRKKISDMVNRGLNNPNIKPGWEKATSDGLMDLGGLGEGYKDVISSNAREEGEPVKPYVTEMSEPLSKAISGVLLNRGMPQEDVEKVLQEIMDGYSGQ